MATFSETFAVTSKKYVSEPGMSILNFSEKLQFFWSHSSSFSLEKQTEKLNFHGLFISKIILSGYFQCNVCTHFQKIHI